MIHTGKFERAELYHNINNEAPEKIKARTGCTTILNGVLFNPDGSFCCDVRINGKWIANDQFTYYGLGWSGKDIPKLVHTNDADKYDNFISCVPVVPNIDRGRSAIGFEKDEYTALCTSDSNGAMTIPEAETEMKKHCNVYLIVDGGGSSYLNCPSGVVDTSYQRKTANEMYILIWEKPDEKDEDTREKKMKICLDPGHGLKEMNQSPDGTYYEHEFALDMANRIRPHLQRCGCEVLLTREDSSTPTLTERAAKANTWDANIYCSLHTNAVPDRDPTDENTPEDGWDDPAGLTVWTCAVGGERERAAKLLLEQMKSAGVAIFNKGLFNANFAVLSHTNMPAYLIEYAFHTNKEDVKLLKSAEYRKKLAEATAKALVEWGGVKWVPDTTPEVVVDKSTMIYHLQFGAFVEEDNAEAMQKILKAAGYTTIIKEEKK